jgi:AcrR family transcriptional regulator
MNGEPERRGRGRRPTGEVRAAALTAAADLLFGEGVAAVTQERVAARAGVSKTTLYKWWPTAGALAAEAYLDRSGPALELPDSGDFAADLHDQMQRFIALIRSEEAGRAIRGILSAAQRDESAREAYLHGYVHPRRRLTEEAFRRAQVRGQIRDDVDFSAFIDQLWGAPYYRLMVEPESLTPAYGAALVDQALRGVAP